MAIVASYDTGPLGDAYNDHQMTRVLEVKDKLRKLLRDENDLPVPIIIVVGDQSHGKSSVIESICGIDLPRGDGMKTKIPLVIKLRDGKKSSATIEYGDDRASTEIEISQVAAMVEEITAQVVGDKRAVATGEIVLTIVRPGNPNLDLIDLPGVTRTDEALEKSIIQLYENRMMRKETVICNVVAATTDIDTSKALQLSKKYDPGRERTLLCITKMDTLGTDDGAAAHFAERIKNDVAETFDVDLHKVFFMRNRSQADTDNSVSIAASAELEANFFGPGSALANRLRAEGFEGFGRGQLIARLVEVQKQRILKWLPDLAERIQSKIDACLHELEPLRKIPSSESACQGALHNVDRDLRKRLSDECAGYLPRNLSDAAAARPASSVMACAKLSVLRDNFLNNVRAAADTATFFSDAMLARLKEDHSRVRGGEALPNQSQPQIAFCIAREMQQSRLYPLGAELAEAAERCVEEWFEEAIASTCQGYPILAKLARKVSNEQIDVLRQRLKGRLADAHADFDVMDTDCVDPALVVSDLPAKVQHALHDGTYTTDLGPSTSTSPTMSDYDQTILEDALRLASYWKAVHKDYIYQIRRMVKRETVSEATLDRFCTSIVERVIPHAQHLLGPSDQHKRKLAHLEVRLGKLEAALAECNSLDADSL